MNRTLTLYDTRRRAKAPFEPADPNNVRMYVCGSTVYERAHIGNARPVVVFDVVFRLLRARFGESHVTYVRNITDVDDKINAWAAKMGAEISSLTERTIAELLEDLSDLNCLEPTVQPRATGHIAEMHRIIEALVAKGHAYVAEDHALFAVASLPGYGSLARRSLDEMVAGARVDVAPYKRDPMDFVLWKPSAPHEPAWPSPAGIAAPGRPGWHVECSAMAHRYLGESFDIHGGGIDLTFPHHENERAQTCAAFGIAEMANVWMHNGYLQLEGRKMSKSEGRYITIRDALTEIGGDVFRLAMLMTHYRQPIDWTERRVAEARAVHANLLAGTAAAAEPDETFLEALCDDLNTPLAIARLGELARAGAASLDASAALIGLDLQAARTALAAKEHARRETLDIDVEALIAERLQARAERRYADADRIRDELAARGIVLKDGKDATGAPSTTWSFDGGSPA